MEELPELPHWHWQYCLAGTNCEEEKEGEKHVESLLSPHLLLSAVWPMAIHICWAVGPAYTQHILLERLCHESVHKAPAKGECINQAISALSL